MRRKNLTIACITAMLLVLAARMALTVKPTAAAQNQVNETITIPEPVQVNVPTVLSDTVTFITSIDAPNLINHPAPNQTVQFFVDGTSVGSAVTDANGIAQVSYVFTTPGDHTVRAYSATSIVCNSMDITQGACIIDRSIQVTVLPASASPTPSPSLSPTPLPSLSTQGTTTSTTNTTNATTSAAASAIPGFETIFALAGIITAAYVIKRRR